MKNLELSSQSKLIYINERPSIFLGSIQKNRTSCIREKERRYLYKETNTILSAVIVKLLLFQEGDGDGVFYFLFISLPKFSQI